MGTGVVIVFTYNFQHVTTSIMLSPFYTVHIGHIRSSQFVVSSLMSSAEVLIGKVH
jgi:hypothetical protein